MLCVNTQAQKDRNKRKRAKLKAKANNKPDIVSRLAVVHFVHIADIVTDEFGVVDLTKSEMGFFGVFSCRVVIPAGVEVTVERIFEATRKCPRVLIGRNNKKRKAFLGGVYPYHDGQSYDVVIDN